MIYATDLDRTLIFSKKFIENKVKQTNIQIEPVEYKDDKLISYISTRVKNELIRINKRKNIVFVAVTTRSIEEYQRIKLPIIPEYTICSNGGTILHKGNILESYETYIKNVIDTLDINLENEIDKLKTVKSICNIPRIVDNKYIFCKTNNEEKFLAESIVKFDKTKFTVTVQRGKCYIIPNGINKSNSLKWLKKYLKEDYILAVGDSELDIPMLQMADYGFTQKHGELYKQGIVPAGVQVINGGVTSPLITLRMAREISVSV